MNFSALSVVILRPCLLAALLAGAGGCTFKKAAPHKLTFLLEANRPTEAAATTTNRQATLRVGHLQMAAPFESRSFVYRWDDLNYEADFYHEFLIAPRALFTEQVHRWFSNSPLYRAVFDPTVRTEATHRLEGRVAALYGDFRDKAAPKAVLAIKFVLVKVEAGQEQILWHRDYREEVPLENRRPPALAQGWSKALAQILRSLEQDVAKVPTRSR
jgi:cholesterol transport system auxiliary component